jgi:hypothetical protein
LVETPKARARRAVARRGENWSRRPGGRGVAGHRQVDAVAGGPGNGSSPRDEGDRHQLRPSLIRRSRSRDWATLFDGLPEEAFAALPVPQRPALDAALFVDDADPLRTDPQALPRAVLGVVRSLAADTPLLVAIDDEQWLDQGCDPQHS